MKKTIKYKNLISLIAVLVITVSIFTVPADAAYSVFGQRMKAGIAAAITALNITMNSTMAPIQEMIDYIGDPMDVDYTWAEAWNDRPQIQIWNDYIEIDGKQYTDIWISNEAAEKFRVNAFDFVSANNIVSQDNGTFASGKGYIDGLPVYQMANGDYQTQYMQIPSTIGDWPLGTNTYIRNSYSSPSRNSVQAFNGANSMGGSSATYHSEYPLDFYYTKPNGQNLWYLKYMNKQGTVGTKGNMNLPGFVSSPFDFDWVSNTIPVNTPLPEDKGMMIRVPSNDPLGNPYFDDFLVDNPEFDTGEPLTIDVTLDPDIMNKLEDLFDIIVPIIPVINNNFGDIQFIENHEAPAPVVDNLLPDTYKQEIMQPIYENFQQTQQTITQMGDTIVENIPNINDICNNIDTAPYHDLDTGLDRLPTVFLPFITDLRSALGIWHYVTEWLGQISTTFAFISGCLVGTSIMTPIYAAIAGFMCIKVYRRMTG